MMHSLEEAMRYNNQGVALLLEGQDRNAAKALSTSLAMVQRVLQRQQSSSANQETNMITPDQCQQHTSPPASCHLKKVLHSSVPLENFRANEGEYFIYNRALTLSHSEEDSETMLSNADAMIVYSTCVMHNLALTYHRRGIISGMSFCLDKTEYLYATIVNLLSAICDHQSTTGTAMLVYMAAVNNRSQILYQRVHDIRKVLAPLVGLLLLNSNNAESIIATRALFEEQELCGLFGNFLLVLRPDGFGGKSFAPAA
jgi:hypothetical protein